MAEYQKVKGQRYRVLANKTQQIWKQLSFKTAAEDVYFSDNESESLTSIQGLAYSKTLVKNTSRVSMPIATLTNQSRIDVYTDTYGVYPNNMQIDGHTLILDFPPQDVDVTVKVIVGSFVNAASN